MDDSSNIVLVSSSNMARCATAAVAPTALKTIFTVACVAQGSTKCCRHEYCLEMERDGHIGDAYHNGFAGRFIQHMFVWVGTVANNISCKQICVPTFQPSMYNDVVYIHV